MTDGFVQTPADNTGKRVEAEERTGISGTVYRLRMSVPGSVDVRGDLLELLLREMQITNFLLAEAFDIPLAEMTDERDD